MTDQFTDAVRRILLAEDFQSLQDLFDSVKDWNSMPSAQVDDCLQLLVRFGFSGRATHLKSFVDQILNDGCTPDVFSCAVLCLNDIGQTLLEQEPSLIKALDKNGNNPLHIAAERGNTEFASLLCSLGADVNALNSDGHSPLHEALHAGPLKLKPAWDVVELLLASGATVDFHSLAALGKSDQVRNWFDAELHDVNVLDTGGRTALFHAAHNGHVEAVKTLLSLGADPNMKNLDGETSLSTACLHTLSQECDQVIIDELIAHGANETVESAILREDLEQIGKFIHKDASLLDAQDHESALGYAIHAWRPLSLQHLIELGASPDGRNWDHIERIAKDPSFVTQLRHLAS